MTYYYETAPLPAALALVRAPRCRSGGTTSRAGRRSCSSCVVPFVHLRRRAACACSPPRVFTGFQLVNAATANYGFFCYLALRAARLPARRRRRARGSLARAALRRARAATSWRAARACCCASPLHLGAVTAFAASPTRQPAPCAVAARHALYAPFRWSTPTTCSASITRDPHRGRVPDQRRRRAGPRTTSATSPAPCARRPPYVAPHQPRVDFQLWFYGLSASARGTPELRRASCSSGCAAIRRRCSRCSSEAAGPGPNAVRIVDWEITWRSLPIGGAKKLCEARPIRARCRAMKLLAFPRRCVMLRSTRSWAACRCGAGEKGGAEVDLADFRELEMPLDDAICRRRDSAGRRGLARRLGAAEGVLRPSPKNNYFIRGHAEELGHRLGVASVHADGGQGLLLDVDLGAGVVGGARGLPGKRAPELEGRGATSCPRCFPSERVSRPSTRRARSPMPGARAPREVVQVFLKFAEKLGQLEEGTARLIRRPRRCAGSSPRPRDG